MGATRSVWSLNGDNFDAQADGTTPGNWLIWDNVAPSGGNIVITIDSTQSAAFGDVNALRLEEVNANTPVTMDVNKTPECSGGLTMTNNTFLQDVGDQIDFIHNNVAGNTTANLPAGVVQRWSRVWDYTVTDVVGAAGGTVDITFDFVLAGMNLNSPPAGTAGNYKLLHLPGSSGNFSVVASGVSVDTANWTVTFTGVDSTLLSGEITLGTIDVGNSPTAVTLQSISANSATAILPIVMAALLLAVMGGVVLRRRS